MNERSTFDAFEQRIADELERYVAPAADLRPASEIADAAMRPRSLVVRARNASRPRRFLLLGLVAAILVPAAYLGATAVRPPAPDMVTVVQPTAEPSVSIPFSYVSILVRRHEGPEPGISIYAVEPGGGEALVREVPDSILTGPGTLSQWGTVSDSGWLALGVEHNGGPWPMVLVDLGQADSIPWVVDEANLGGIGPKWAPTGLIAAYADSSSLVIADPETRTTRRVSMGGYSLVGGGPSIIWTADGSGIVGSGIVGASGLGGMARIPIDGSTPGGSVKEVFDPGGSYGPSVARMSISDDGGRVESVAPDASGHMVWQRIGDDRALAASFGHRPDEYWLTLDHDGGRQVALVHRNGEDEDTVADVNRDVTWRYVGAPVVSPDGATAVLWIDIGAKLAAVVVPVSGTPQSFHTGHFAGFVDVAASTIFAAAEYQAPTEAMPASGKAYALPSVDELIAAELSLNPGRRVLGKMSRDAVGGDTGTRTFDVQRDERGVGDVYLDCLGSSSVTVTSGSQTITSPCLAAGSYVGAIDESGPIVVTARGDTSWRVVIYST